MDCQNAVFRCSSYVALPSIIPHGRGEGERFVYSCYGDVWHSVSKFKSSYVRSTVGSGYFEFCRVGGIAVINMYNIVAKVSGSWGTTLVGTVP